MSLHGFAWSMLVFVLIPATPVGAQVIEINASGEAMTYDRPTVFTDDGSSPAITPSVPTRSLMALPVSSLRSVEQQYGLADGLLDALVYRESRGRMSAISSKGALGIMQLMPGTAAELGVDPRDRDQNIRGGAIYLKRQIDRFGTIPLALAAYNAGPGAVQRYGGIPPYRETQAYVSAIMARWRPRKGLAAPLARVAYSDPISNPLLIEVSAP